MWTPESGQAVCTRPGMTNGEHSCAPRARRARDGTTATPLAPAWPLGAGAVPNHFAAEDQLLVREMTLVGAHAAVRVEEHATRHRTPAHVRKGRAARRTSCAWPPRRRSRSRCSRDSCGRLRRHRPHRHGRSGPLGLAPDVPPSPASAPPEPAGGSRPENASPSQPPRTRRTRNRSAEIPRRPLVLARRPGRNPTKHDSC